MKTKTIIVFLIGITVLLITACKKSADTSTSSIQKLTVFQDSKFANIKDTLQAVFKPANSDITYTFYGSFDNNGSPLKVNEIVYSRNDTTVKMILDDSSRVKTSLFLYKNIKDSIVLFYRYTDTTIAVTTAAFYWNTKIHKIKSVTYLKRSDYNYRGIITFNLNPPIERNIATPTTFGVFDDAKFLVINVGSILVANAATVAVYTAGGAIIGGSATIGIGALPGAIIGGMIGVNKVLKQAVNDINNQGALITKIVSDDNTYPVSPQIDLQGTEVADNDIDEGGLEKSKSSNDYPPTPTQSSASYDIDLSLEIELNKSHSAVISSILHTTWVTEYWQSGSGTTFYKIPIIYSKSSYSIVGNNISISFTTPVYSFSGTIINGNHISGSVYIQHTNGVPAVSTPIEIDCVN